MEKHDFSNKTIVIFATSGGSSFGKTIDNLKSSVSPSTKIVQSEILNSNLFFENFEQWIKSLKL